MGRPSGSMPANKFSCVPPAPHGKHMRMHHQVKSLLLTPRRHPADRLLLKRKRLPKRQHPQITKNHKKILTGAATWEGATRSDVF